jgi:hypothetical protein
MTHPHAEARVRREDGETPVIRAIDHLLAIETPAMRWLRKASAQLRAQEAEERR